MHELSLSGAIVDTVTKHADGRPVRLVSVRIGRLRQVVPETLAFYFEFVARGSICEGATLEQEIVPAVLGCAPCEREWSLDAPLFRCPSCGGSEIAVVSGNEFEVESIDVEEVTCIAPR